MATYPVHPRARLVVVTALLTGATALGLTPATAATVPLGSYTAALPIQPFPTVAGSVDPSGLGFPVSFTNTSPNGYLLTSVTVHLPAGFAVTGAPTTNASGWSADASGSTVTASAASPIAHGVPAGAAVTLVFNAVAPAAAGRYPFATSATGLIAATGVVGDFTRSAADPAVDVHPYANVVTCAPDQTCDTGQVGSDQGTQARITTTTGAIQDYVALSVDTPTDPACMSLIDPTFRSQQISFQSLDTTRTLTQTIRVDKSVVNQLPDNGVGNVAVCHNTEGSPSRTTFVDAAGNTVTAGLLPKCSTPGLPPRNPCVSKISKSGSGDVLVTMFAPGGDPRDIIGLPAALSRTG